MLREERLSLSVPDDAVMFGYEVLFIDQLLIKLLSHGVRILVGNLDGFRLEGKMLIYVVLRIVSCCCNAKVVHEAHARTVLLLPSDAWWVAFC